MSEPQHEQPRQERSKIVKLPPRSIDAPYSQEAEEAVIGSVLINPEVISRIARFLKADDFYFLRHSYIWQAIMALRAENSPIDNLILAKKLEDLGMLDDIGGPAFLTHLIANTPTAVHAEIYAQLVQRAAVRRQLMKAADEIKARALDESVSIQDVLKASQSKLEDVATPLNVQGIRHIEDALNEQFDRIEQAMQDKGPGSKTALGGMPSGIADLDSMIDGFHRSRVYVIAARTHMGKTGFMHTVALNASAAGKRVAIFNVADGTERDVINSLVSMETGIRAHHIDTGRLEQREYERYVEAAGRLAKRNIFIRSQKNLSPREIYDECRALISAHGLDMVIIDYLQRMQPVPSGDPKERAFRGDQRGAINYISDSLMKMGPMVNAPVLVGAQINRAGRSRGKSVTRPDMSHIKESGNIEEDADCVMLLHRRGYYDQNAYDPDMTEIIVAKNRITRQTGIVKTVTSQNTRRFYDYTPSGYERRDIP